MSKKKYEVSVVTGKYTNRDGVEKNRYQRIGSVIETRNGLMLKLDVIPLVENGWSGWCFLNPPKPQEPTHEGLPQDDDFEDSIPF